MSIFFSKRIKHPIIINKKQNEVTIETHRLILKSFNQIPYSTLQADYISLFTRAENVSYYSFGKPWTLEEVNRFLFLELDRKNRGELYGSFAVYEKGSNQFVGNLGIQFKDEEFADVGIGHPNAAELSYILKKESWGHGYGTELSILGKKYAKFLNHEKVEKPQEIVATVHPLNIASKKILEKTLKKRENQEIIKFAGNPRLLFYKKLKNNTQNGAFERRHSC